MARHKLQRILQTFTRTPTTPTRDASANTGTDNEMFNRVLGVLAEMAGVDWYATKPTTLQASKDHIDSTDGTAHGGVVNRVQAANVDQNKRRKINFTGSGVTVTDDSAGDRVNVAISSGGAGGTDHTLLSSFHTDTLAADTPANGDVVRRVSGAWEASPVTHDNVATANKDGADATPGMRSLGTGAGQALPGNHANVHARAHAMGSTLDHSDAPLTAPNDGDTFRWSAADNHFIFSPPAISKATIDGLALTWDSGTTLGVEPGTAFIPGLGKLIEVTSRLTITPTFPASSTAWHYVYLRLSGGTTGTPELRVSTTVPVVYHGVASHEMGDANTRYLGAILPNGATTPTMRKFRFNAKSSFVQWMESVNTPPFVVYDVTSTPITATTIDCSAVIPVTTVDAFLCIWVYVNQATSGRAVYFGNSDLFAGNVNSTNFLLELNPFDWSTSTDSLMFPLNASRQLQVIASSSSNTWTGVAVRGYQENR